MRENNNRKVKSEIKYIVSKSNEKYINSDIKKIIELYKNIVKY